MLSRGLKPTHRLCGGETADVSERVLEGAAFGDVPLGARRAPTAGLTRRSQSGTSAASPPDSRSPCPVEQDDPATLAGPCAHRRQRFLRQGPSHGGLGDTRPRRPCALRPSPLCRTCRAS